MTKLGTILVATVALAACGGSAAQTPTETPAAAPAAPAAPAEAAEAAPTADVLVLREMTLRAGDDSLRLTADGAILYEGKEVGRLYPDGRVEVVGQVVATLRADGRFDIVGEPDEDIRIGDDGALYVRGQLTAEIGPDGVYADPRDEEGDGDPTVIEGPPEGRRAAVLALLVAVMFDRDE